MRWVCQGLVSVLIVSCTAPNPRVCRDGTCPDPAYPFCDIDGEINGTANACIAVSCAPMEFAACRGDSAVICAPSGSNYDVTECAAGCSETNEACNACAVDTAACSGDALKTCGPDGLVASSEKCALGCVEAPNPHCRYLQPKYLPDVCDTPASSASLIVSSSGTLDTNLSASCNGGVVVQTGGPEICVVRYGAISLQQGVSLVASGARALAMVSDQDLSIDGFLDVSAEGFDSGPGGGTLRSGGFGASPNGSGGAGFKTAGGSGGSSTMNGGAGNAGAALADPAALTVLVGGPQSAPDPWVIGGGGGAATLVSCRGTVLVNGEIHAGGGGGDGGNVFFGTVLGGSGGGAGGNVVLQGAAVAVTGKLFANGGSGGAGKPSDAAKGAKGYEGERAAIVATGALATSGEGAGGDGGAGTTLPGSGGRLTIAGASAGGGGGSVGYFQSYTPAGVTPTLTPSAASPAPQPNGTIPTR